MRPATVNKRSRLGYRARAGAVEASVCIHALSSQAMVASSQQIWFWSKPCSGRFRRPVSFAHRIGPHTVPGEGGTLPSQRVARVWRRGKRR